MRKNTVVKEYELPVDVKKDGRYFVATCPVWSDCYAQGYSLENAVQEIEGVAKTLIEIYEEEDKKIPLKLKSQNKSYSRYKFNLSVLSPAF